MVSTKSVHEQLAAAGLQELARWQRGVDTTIFRPLRQGVSRPAAADRCVCRACGGREEHRRVSAHALERIEDRRGGWA